MNQEEAFLADIRDNPDDDAPRLVYADWLDEHMAEGTPQRARAEFIRLQIEHSRLQNTDSRRSTQIKRRLNRILAEHRQTWKFNEPRNSNVKLFFHRGFISGVRAHASTFLRRIDDLIKLYPLLQSAHLHHAQSHIRDVMQHPALLSFRELGISDARIGISDDDMPTIAASPNVRHLRTLEIPGEIPVMPKRRITFVGAGTLASSPNLQQLEQLYLPFQCIGVEGTLRLLQALSKLRYLNVFWNLSPERDAELIQRNTRQDVTLVLR